MNSRIKGDVQWASETAERIISRDPNREVYTVAAGISPSGIVHFGNLRDVITSHLVGVELKKRGKKCILLFSWDNFDRFRKVPIGVPEHFSEHIGKPLSRIPDPFGELSSYAERFQRPFVEAMDQLKIKIDYRDQTKLYESGTYDNAIIEALNKRKEIADVLLSFMSEKAKGEKGIDPSEYRENYYPVSIYSRFTGKDTTKVLDYDGKSTLTYLCIETGKTDTFNLTEEHILKLAWKVDWPMRWRHEKVVFEPAGHDHASPGGSYDVSSLLSKKIFDYDPPIFVEYKFVGIQGLGAKMSGSSGNAVSPSELLEIYEPELLKWLYCRKTPSQSFELAFNTEIYRQYDEYDAEEKKGNPIPFRQAVGFGQIVQWQEDKLWEMIEAMGLGYDKESIERRLPLARQWLEKYNPQEVIKLSSSPNKEYFQALSSDRQKHIKRLCEELTQMGEVEVKELEALVYEIPKSQNLDEAALKKEQRAFFKDVYNLLINKDTGPRLGTFLWALDRQQVLKLLDFPVIR